ncbi:hypothetical protein M1839_005963 [Neofusicoccum parvum]|uniref:Uncharacterized protein n=1 Tax=Neofusicoccum parvum TaxID=310453 RepID=A0ACB5SPT0_9PEZI|nr:hypothetical protein M1839_005963 [Neofusicoccum parvum]
MATSSRASAARSINDLAFNVARVGVVVPLGKKTATYYGLINLDKKTGLCEGILVPQDEVFYFAEFRDDKLVNNEERRQKWGRIIREKINKDTVSSVNNYCRTSRLDVAPNLSLAVEVVRLGTSYSITKGVEYLRYLRRLLEPYDDKDAHEWDSEKNGTIFKLMNPGPVLTLEEAQKAVEQLKPTVGDFWTVWKSEMNRVSSKMDRVSSKMDKTRSKMDKMSSKMDKMIIMEGSKIAEQGPHLDHRPTEP